MPIASSFPQGTPIWVDLQTSDQPAASAFYRDLFGWEVADASAATGGYSRASLGGTPVAAIGPFPPMVTRPVWTVYFSVDDIAASATAAAQTGGAVLLPPGEVMPGLQLSIVADAAGAVLGLWQRDKDSPWLRDEPGAVDWLELVSPDPAASFPFYESVLGVGVSEMKVGENPYDLFDVGETSVAGAYRSDGQDPAHWVVYFNVDDLDAAIARLTGLGGSVLTGPMTAQGVGRWAEAADPQGAAFALLEPEQEPV